MRPHDKADYEDGEPRVGEPPVDAGQRAAMERVPREPRNHMVGDAEDHHRHEAEQRHVQMCRPVDEPRRIDGHPDAERHGERQPRQTRLDECLDEPLHYDAPVARSPSRGEMSERSTKVSPPARMPCISFGTYATSSPASTSFSPPAPETGPRPAITVSNTVDVLR